VRVIQSVVAGLLVAAVPLLAGSHAADARVHQQGAKAAVDVCALFPKEEASKVLGRTVSRSARGTLTGADPECRYFVAMEGTITISVAAGMPKSQWDGLIKDLTAAGAQLKPTAGVGDGAYFLDNHRIYAHSGSHAVTVSKSSQPGDDPAKVRADGVALANAVIAKLSK
jgi:hypothetical protein